MARKRKHVQVEIHLCDTCKRPITDEEIELYRLEANDDNAVPRTCENCVEKEVKP